MFVKLKGTGPDFFPKNLPFTTMKFPINLTVRRFLYEKFHSTLAKTIKTGVSRSIFLEKKMSIASPYQVSD